MKFAHISRPELHTPTLLFILGAWFLLFDVAEVNPSYVRMTVLRGWIWALIFLGAGILKAVAIIRERRKLEMVSCVCLIVLYSALSIIIGIENITLLAVPFFAYCAFLRVLRFFELFYNK